MRFRMTALPKALVTVNPIFGPFSCLACLRQNAAKNGHEKREPSSYTLRKSLRRRIRKVLGKEK